MSTVIETWNASFGIAGLAAIVAGHEGLPCIQITTPSASGEIYLHGAQVTGWRPSGNSEVLFLSDYSRWEEGKAIRGGIPVCFPWFRAKADNPKAPAHGFARTRAWALRSITQAADNVIVTLSLKTDDSTRTLWPHDTEATLRISMGTELHLALTIKNTGPNSFTFEEALHTYHRVGDVTQAAVSGLAGVAFLDNVNQNREIVQSGNVVMTQPTDNAYLETTSALELVDPVLHRRLHIEKRNSRTTVVWNPWAEGAQSLTDLGNDEWRQMACVEASNILVAAVTLAPGEEHTMETTITVVAD